MPAGEASRDSAVSAAYHEPGGQGSGFAGAIADLTVAVGQISDSLAAGARKPVDPRIPWDACHPVWQTGSIPLVAGAGTLIQSALYGPELPYWWDVRSVRVWGFTAGTVTVYRNNPASLSGEQFGSTSVPGEFTWSAQLLLSPQDSLVFGATGITGSVFMAMQGIEVASGWLAEYLM